MSCIPPVFQENKFIPNLKVKLELLKHYFVNQCSLLSNNRVLPADLPQLANKYLDSINFLSSDIAKRIGHFDRIKCTVMTCSVSEW